MNHLYIIGLWGLQTSSFFKCVKKRCYEETFEGAKKSICKKVGHEVASRIIEEYSQSTEREKNSMIKVLLEEGKSQVEVKALAGTGGL